MEANTTYVAVVESIIRNGSHGPYAVAKPVGKIKGVDGSITFGLKPTVWHGEDEPEPGSHVVLSRLEYKRAGWRAKSARYLQPSDQQPKGRERSSA